MYIIIVSPHIIDRYHAKRIRRFLHVEPECVIDGLSALDLVYYIYLLSQVDIGRVFFSNIYFSIFKSTTASEKLNIAVYATALVL